MIITLLSSLPSLLCLLRKPTIRNFNISFFAVSMSFFIFSFHVHEKTIMLPFLPCLFSIFDLLEMLPSFSLIAIFSLFPLLKREDQVVTYISSIIGYFLLSSMLSNNFLSSKRKEGLWNYFFKMMDFINVTLVIIYHVFEYNINPPSNFPYLYPLMNATLSFGNFVIFYLYANYVMFYRKDNIDDELQEDMVITNEKIKID